MLIHPIDLDEWSRTLEASVIEDQLTTSRLNLSDQTRQIRCTWTGVGVTPNVIRKDGSARGQACAHTKRKSESRDLPYLGRTPRLTLGQGSGQDSSLVMGAIHTHFSHLDKQKPITASETPPRSRSDGEP